MKPGARVLPCRPQGLGCPRASHGRARVGTSHPSPGPWGSGTGVWHPLPAGNWAPKVSAVLWGVDLGWEPTLTLTLPSICMDSLGSPTPAEERRWELEELGLCWSPHPHPRLPLDTAVGLMRMQPGGVTSGSGNSPCSGPGDKPRLLPLPFPTSSPAPRPAGLSALPRCWPPGTWLCVGVSVPGGMHGGVGEGGGGSAAILAWAARCGQAGCWRDARGTLGLPSGKARRPLGARDPWWLH